MPIIKSAKKRVKTAAKANSRNLRTKRSLRLALKVFFKAIDSGNSADIQKAQNKAASALDTAAKKAVIHKNKAARLKAGLSSKARAAGVKPGKAAAKKAPPKTAASPKKPTKAATRRPAAKKPAVKK